MEVRESQTRLRELLAISGFRFDLADVALGWSAFKRFVREPVRCADDSIAVSARLVDTIAGNDLSLRLQRIFEIIDSEKYFVTTVSLSLDFRTHVGNPRAVHTMSLSTARFRRLDVFLDAVESDPIFQHALTLSPWTCALTAWAPKGKESWLESS